MLSENESWVVIANISNRIRRSQNNTTNESIDKEAYNRHLMIGSIDVVLQ